MVPSLSDRNGTDRVYGAVLRVGLLLITFLTDQITGTLKIEHRLFNLGQSALVSNTIQMDSCLYLQKLSSAQW